MKVVRLVKNSDFKSVEHLVKHSGKGMTTMPKTPKEIKERIAWSEKSRNKKTKKPKPVVKKKINKINKPLEESAAKE